MFPEAEVYPVLLCPSLSSQYLTTIKNPAMSYSPPRTISRHTLTCTQQTLCLPFAHPNPKYKKDHGERSFSPSPSHSTPSEPTKLFKLLASRKKPPTQSKWLPPKLLRTLPSPRLPPAAAASLCKVPTRALERLQPRSASTPL